MQIGMAAAPVSRFTGTDRWLSGDTMGARNVPKIGKPRVPMVRGETENRGLPHDQKCLFAAPFGFAAPLPARGRFSKKCMDGCPTFWAGSSRSDRSGSGRPAGNAGLAQRAQKLNEGKGPDPGEGRSGRHP